MASPAERRLWAVAQGVCSVAPNSAIMGGVYETVKVPDWMSGVVLDEVVALVKAEILATSVIGTLLIPQGTLLVRNESPGLIVQWLPWYALGERAKL